MKRLAITAVLLAAASSPALAVQTWQGDIYITAVTAACESVGIKSNTFYRAVYRPKNIEDNGSVSKLAFFSSINAHSYTFSNVSSSGTGRYTGVVINSWPKVLRYSGTFENTSFTPTTFSATTQTLVVRLTLKNFVNTPGCSVTLRAGLGNSSDT
jgi:hypothetical protein